MTTRPDNMVHIIRDVLGLTQQELADRAGLSRQQVSRMETGRVELSHERVCPSGCVTREATEAYMQVVRATLLRKRTA